MSDVALHKGTTTFTESYALKQWQAAGGDTI